MKRFCFFLLSLIIISGFSAGFTRNLPEKVRITNVTSGEAVELDWIRDYNEYELVFNKKVYQNDLLRIELDPQYQVVPPDERYGSLSYIMLKWDVCIDGEWTNIVDRGDIPFDIDTFRTIEYRVPGLWYSSHLSNIKIGFSRSFAVGNEKSDYEPSPDCIFSFDIEAGKTRFSPNPAFDDIEIVVSGPIYRPNGMNAAPYPAKTAKAEIYDFYGTCKKSIVLTSNPMTVSVRELPEGKYVLRIILPDGTTESHVLIIAR